MNSICFKALAAVLLTVSWTIPGFAGHWGYTGDAGPENWSKLDPAFAACGEGRNQSPIDLGRFTKADLKPLSFEYKPGALDIINNGHAIQADYAPGSALIIQGNSFELKQFHFHSPSEHTVRGKFFPLECHLVHSDKAGNVAVVAILFEQGEANPLIAKLWEMMPAGKDKKVSLPAGLSAAGLLPSSREYYYYSGSLTTPPCSEGVRWAVLKRTVTVSTEQVAKFAGTLGFANNRPVQPVNARMVLE